MKKKRTKFGLLGYSHPGLFFTNFALFGAVRRLKGQQKHPEALKTCKNVFAYSLNSLLSIKKSLSLIRNVVAILCPNKKRRTKKMFPGQDCSQIRTALVFTVFFAGTKTNSPFTINSVCDNKSAVLRLLTPPNLFNPTHRWAAPPPTTPTPPIPPNDHTPYQMVSPHRCTNS